MDPAVKALAHAVARLRVLLPAACAEPVKDAQSSGAEGKKGVKQSGFLNRAAALTCLICDNQRDIPPGGVAFMQHGVCFCCGPAVSGMRPARAGDKAARGAAAPVSVRMPGRRLRILKTCVNEGKENGTF